MIDVYIGTIDGNAEGVLQLEFDTFAEASKFCDTLKDHYKEERKRLYMAIDTNTQFYDLEEVFEDEKREDGTIDADMFRAICEKYAQG